MSTHTVKKKELRKSSNGLRSSYIPAVTKDKGAAGNKVYSRSRYVYRVSLLMSNSRATLALGTPAATRSRSTVV